MKRLILVLAILMLGCDTDTEVAMSPRLLATTPHLTREYSLFTKSDPLRRITMAIQIHHVLLRATYIPAMKGFPLILPG